MDILFIIVALAMPISGFFFWGRGLVKSNKGDIVLGFSVLGLECVFGFVFDRSSAVFGELGMIFLIFGVETLIVSAFAKPNCPLSKKERIALGIGALAAGGFLSMIV